MINLIIAAAVVLIVPTIFGLVRQRLLKRRGGRKKPPVRPEPEAAETGVSSLLSRQSAGVFPAAKDLPQRDALVARTVAMDRNAPLPPSNDIPPTLDRIRKLPPLKQAIAWSEILAEPKGIKPTE